MHRRGRGEKRLRVNHMVESEFTWKLQATCSSSASLFCLPVHEWIGGGSNYRWQLGRIWDIFVVGNIILVLHCWLVRSGGFQFLKLLEIQCLKPRVLQDVISAVLQVTIALA